MAGLGETGTELARKLLLNWDVIGVDPDPVAISGHEVGGEHHEALKLHSGDATSALVLRKAGLEGVHAAVACTGSDEVNMEVLRMARELFGIHNLYTLMYSLEWEERYAENGIEVVSQDHACAAILESRIARGQKVASDIGLGIGEIMEVEVLPSSSIIGRTLMDLQPRRWLVAAIYRDNRLVVPHGETKVLEKDRVLLVGDPDILPSVATLIRTGESEFPLQYGSHVVSIFEPGLDRVLEETAYLIDTTRAERFETIACEIDAGNLEALRKRCEGMKIPCEISCKAGGNVRSLLHEVGRSDVGVFVLPPEKIGTLAMMGLGRTRAAGIMDLVHSPVLMSRKTFPYRKVLLVMAELPFPSSAAQLAIDLVRMVDAGLDVAVVHQPDLVVGKEMSEDLEKRWQEVRNLAGMYHVDVTERRLDGNPIRQVMGISGEYDLVVVPYRKRKRTFLTRPDISLNILHGAPCSVMAMPV